MPLRETLKNTFPVLDSMEMKLRLRYAEKYPEKYAERLYRNFLGKEINWKNPVDYNEKIQWLKFYSDTSAWSDLSDKYKVREYVKECGFESILNTLYAKYDSIDDINITNLPDSFVIKANNGCGDTLIVPDKSKITNEEVKKHFWKMSKPRFGILSAEPHYLKIKPCIIAEKLLTDTSPFSCSLIDYKFLCFNGMVIYILVCSNRKDRNTDMLIYDLDWNPRYDVMTSKASRQLIPKPDSLALMVRACETLSSSLPEVRIDFYEIEGKPVFGEMTFTPCGGFVTAYEESFLKELGDYIKLP